MPPRSKLAEFREKLDRSYGDRVAPRVSVPAPHESVSTGSLTLDYALRTGGLVVGRIYELVGAPDCAKTTVVINAAAEFQRRFPDRAVGYVDMEGTFDDHWAVQNGLDLGELWDHVYPEHSE